MIRKTSRLNAFTPFIALAALLTAFACTHSAQDTKNTAGALAVATFAGGCFWCIEATFQPMEGVVEATSGYSGGTTPNPTYDQVSSGRTEHVEAVRITYDPTILSYEDLLNTFWRQIDPTDATGSFVDRGPHYRSVIFYHNHKQRQAAERSKARLLQLRKFKKPIATEIVKADEFYPAEEYHQDYFSNNPVRYKFYRYRSGRDQFIEETWENDDSIIAIAPGSRYTKPPIEKIRAMLTDEQFYVTQEDGTERAFQNQFYDNKAPGIYVDIVTGEPLFSSTHKYKSGTGWPSFTQPIKPGVITKHEDNSLFSTRVEIRSRFADSHLGHVFGDGPAPTGLRYCINSAALRFIPADKLTAQGYTEFNHLFRGN